MHGAGAAMLIAGVACVAAFVPSRPAAAQADPLAAYLEELDLRSLLVTRLERLVTESTTDARPALLARLASLYAELLDAADEPEERRRLLDRAQSLVDAAGRDGTESLELAIARADYRTAERVAERWRVRAAEPEEREAARTTLAEVATRLGELERRVGRTLERARSRSNRAEDTQAIDVSETLDTALLLRGEIDYLAGWTAYYRAWLGGEDVDVDLDEAEERFERLLELGDAGAVPSAVDRDLLSGEGYARAVLGMALVRGLRSRTDEVRRWLATLEDPDANPDVQAELPAWRLSVLIEDGDWRAVRDELERLVGGEDVPADWYRLVAARALETERDAIADLAARTAVAELGRRGELATLFALVDRFGTGRLGDRGFLVAYVEAAAAFSRAAETHGRRPATDAAAGSAWREVAGLLENALAAPDATDTAGTVPEAERLLGWALWYAGDADEAWRRFASAADSLPPAASSEASWMTIVALQQLVDGGRGEMREEIARRTDAFLERFPGHPRAPALRARRLSSRPDATVDQDVAALRAVPRGHPQWRTSRETVAGVLVRRYRAGGETAADAGAEYIEVAEELLDASEADRADGADPEPFAVDTARLILEIALDPRIGATEAAGRALARVATWESGGWSPGSVRAELRYRRVQWLLERGGWMAAATAAADCAGDDPFGSAWSRAALRRVLAAPIRGRDELARAWALARPVLEAVEPASVQPVDGLRLAVAAAEIGQRRWREGRDDSAASVVLEAMKVVRGVHSGERRALQFTGRAAAVAGEEALALECWRALSDGLSPPDPEWYEARFELASVLASIDRARALRVMRQHAVLEPEYGPLPWGPRLRELHARLEAGASEGEDVEDADGAADAEDAGGSGAGP